MIPINEFEWEEKIFRFLKFIINLKISNSPNPRNLTRFQRIDNIKNFLGGLISMT